uniref:Uncharacterized protein LOC104221925 isoform X2 n=1 Tax=Nicotiana sylvestris TaxID=4096 RepID=A0A1U7VYD8_NICSY|nr:PREDICTED: uncharacterized protein LOC104221925 isoform X2 [Nicotiana sylvestris]
MNITQVTLSNNSNNSRREIFDPELWKLRAANRRVVEEYEMLLLPSGGLKAQEILQTVNAFGWRSFVQCPGDYNRNIVLEFYSNLNPVSRTSTVRCKSLSGNTCICTNTISHNNDGYKQGKWNYSKSDDI